MCCWKGREPLGPRDSLCFCLRVSDLILTPSGRDRAGPGEGLWEEWWCLRTWLRRGQQGCCGAGSVCVLRGGVLGEWDVARDLFLRDHKFWSHHRAQPGPWGASIFPCVSCPQPICHVAAGAASPPALPRSPHSSWVSVCSFMGGVPLPITPSGKEEPTPIFLLLVRPSPQSQVGKGGGR